MRNPLIKPGKGTSSLWNKKIIFKAVSCFYKITALDVFPSINFQMAKYSMKIMAKIGCKNIGYIKSGWHPIPTLSQNHPTIKGPIAQKTTEIGVEN